MKSNSVDLKRPNLWTIRLVFFSVALWMIVVYTGDRFPYLDSDFFVHVRFFVLFPFIFLLAGYVCFFYHKPGQKTGYMQAMQRLSSRKERIKVTVGGLCGLLLVSGTLALTSVAFPAWASQLLAREPYVHVYHIRKIIARSGASWSRLFDLELTNAQTGEQVTLRLNRSRYKLNKWNDGEWICVRGRTSIFGTIIDSEDRLINECR